MSLSLHTSEVVNRELVKAACCISVDFLGPFQCKCHINSVPSKTVLVEEHVTIGVLVGFSVYIYLLSMPLSITQWNNPTVQCTTLQLSMMMQNDDD